MPKKGENYSCKECGAEVVCVAGSCGVSKIITCCGNEMKKADAHSSPREREA